MNYALKKTTVGQTGSEVCGECVSRVMTQFSMKQKSPQGRMPNPVL